ncbi:Sodium channel protein type 8 subunit alpha [Durusdinium trenchii]
MKHQCKAMDKILSRLDLTVTRDRFSKWLEHDSFTAVLERAGIDTSIRTQLFDILDADSGGLLNVDELISGLMSVRGHVTKGDIIAMSLKVRYISQLVETLSNTSLPTESRRRRASSSQ